MYIYHACGIHLQDGTFVVTELTVLDKYPVISMLLFTLLLCSSWVKYCDWISDDYQ